MAIVRDRLKEELPSDSYVLCRDFALPDIEPFILFNKTEVMKPIEPWRTFDDALELFWLYRYSDLFSEKYLFT